MVFPRFFFYIRMRGGGCRVHFTLFGVMRLVYFFSYKFFLLQYCTFVVGQKRVRQKGEYDRTKEEVIPAWFVCV